MGEDVGAVVGEDSGEGVGASVGEGVGASVVAAKTVAVVPSAVAGRKPPPMQSVSLSIAGNDRPFDARVRVDVELDSEQAIRILDVVGNGLVRIDSHAEYLNSPSSVIVLGTVLSLSTMSWPTVIWAHGWVLSPIDAQPFCSLPRCKGEGGAGVFRTWGEALELKDAGEGQRTLRKLLHHRDREHGPRLDGELHDVVGALLDRLVPELHRGVEANDQRVAHWLTEMPTLVDTSH